MANYTENYDLVKPTMAETADIRTINGNMDTVDAIMHDTQVSMADAFDSTKSYAIREKCMYEFKLYQCIHPHTGPWDAGDFERVNAADTGGNYVEITPTYNNGLKIAETNIDGDQDEIDVPYFGGATAQENGTGGAVPAPTSSDVGKFLSSNGGWEVPSGGGGGTTVVPNPVGEPTDDLDTVQIGNTIYNIPGSGGGAGGGSKIVDTLWSGMETPTAGNPYIATLSKAITEYDLIVVDAYERNDGSQMQLVLPASNIAYGEKYSDYYYNTACYVEFTDATHVNLIMFALANLTVYTKITGIKFCGMLAPMIYSTEEREVGVWVDDKPLYQKTIDFGSDQSFNQGWHNAEEHHDIYDSVISGKLVSTSGLAYYVGVACNDTTYLEFYTENTTSEGRYLTITYTKAADVAGSGKYGSLGIPMAHYSADEHVVGTWINGSTLYERTFDQTIASEGAYSIAASGISMGWLESVILEYESGRWFSQNYFSRSTTSSGVFLYSEVNNGGFAVTNQSGATRRFIFTVRYTKS